jgi:hypothetical protein
LRRGLGRIGAGVVGAAGRRGWVVRARARGAGELGAALSLFADQRR